MHCSAVYVGFFAQFLERLGRLKDPPLRSDPTGVRGWCAARRAYSMEAATSFTKASTNLLVRRALRAFLSLILQVGLSRFVVTHLHVIIHDDRDGKRREREVEWEARGQGDVEMVL